MTTRLHDQAVGRWKSILPALGIQREFLTGRHTACPICKEGRDRFRFDDKAGRGSWFCSKCGSGSGVDLVMRVLGVEFLEAKRRIEPLIGGAVFETPRAHREIDPRAHLDTWARANRLCGNDPASLYLRNRGLGNAGQVASIRWMAKGRYYRGDATVWTEHPVMLALFVSPDRETTIVHRTYLTEDGQKANLGCDEKGVPWPAKKMSRGKVPKGGAVRLAPSAETMGIAEGIETAIGAMLLHRVPVWAATSGDCLLHWQPPENARHVLIFGDNDASYAGQYKAFGLAYRLRSMGLQVEVRMPPDSGDDWADVYVAEQEVA